MARPTSVAGFFEQEWARFWEGYDNLSPDAQLAESLKRAKARAKTGQQNTVSIPGWEDVVHLTPRYEPTTQDRAEYWAARRERRPANLTAEARDAIEARIAIAQRIASSSAPPYANAWAQMLTARACPKKLRLQSAHQSKNNDNN